MVLLEGKWFFGSELCLNCVSVLEVFDSVLEASNQRLAIGWMRIERIEGRGTSRSQLIR